MDRIRDEGDDKQVLRLEVLSKDSLCRISCLLFFIWLVGIFLAWWLGPAALGSAAFSTFYCDQYAPADDPNVRHNESCVGTDLRTRGSSFELRVKFVQKFDHAFTLFARIPNPSFFVNSTEGDQRGPEGVGGSLVNGSESEWPRMDFTDFSRLQKRARANKCGDAYGETSTECRELAFSVRLDLFHPGEKTLPSSLTETFRLDQKDGGGFGAIPQAFKEAFVNANHNAEEVDENPGTAGGGRRRRMKEEETGGGETVPKSGTIKQGSSKQSFLLDMVGEVRCPPKAPFCDPLVLLQTRQTAFDFDNPVTFSFALQDPPDAVDRLSKGEGGDIEELRFERERGMVLDSGWILDVLLEFVFRNGDFAMFEGMVRLLCLFISGALFVNLLVSMPDFKCLSWGREQQQLFGLICGLFLFNDPFFVLFFLVYSTVPATLGALCRVTFLSLLLGFWLDHFSIYIRRATGGNVKPHSHKTSAVGRLLLLFSLWVALVVVALIAELRVHRDPFAFAGRRSALPFTESKEGGGRPVHGIVRLLENLARSWLIIGMLIYLCTFASTGINAMVKTAGSANGRVTYLFVLHFLVCIVCLLDFLFGLSGPVPGNPTVFVGVMLSVNLYVVCLSCLLTPAGGDSEDMALPIPTEDPDAVVVDEERELRELYGHSPGMATEKGDEGGASRVRRDRESGSADGVPDVGDLSPDSPGDWPAGGRNSKRTSSGALY
uniref:Wntless-like transmembrane domain-containing protein n=1 Tax=Chromera velia CCMP2878 TaxID=1169474 RepID=A0A0G4HTA7_9ALVE|eukprot:Cvel_8424.t1-p1 / transcript=Cvel_8424.t1 / gene=Cvel_8424 / organism=Chromera_velia_CCMP2878 / gene_product=hypothetical protein / transcript_product=hypothetical protein / location=Cvel_scaffold465:40578-43762(+) / protein_length=717 / sequence_SO=supercontig / SO=protein_coding / is_pseudo=false